MKKLNITVAIAIFSIAGLFAQSSSLNNYEVIETPEWMGNKTQNAYLLAVDTDQKLTLESWASHMDHLGFPTFIADAKQPVLITEGVLLPEISPKKLDIYLQPRYNAQDDGSELTFWFRLPDGSFLSSEDYPGSFEAVSKFLLDFGRQTKKNLEATIHFEELQRSKKLYPPTSSSAN